MKSTTPPPKSIGPYRITGILGTGGMGVVYKAVHPTLERPAAVKVLLPHNTSDPEYLSRFLREARAAASLNNEHIVQVYDAGVHEERYFIAMELVEGQSLFLRVQMQGALDIREGLDLMLQAVHGLGAAHAIGLVHRDIKPENLLITASGLLKIADFGLVSDSTTGTRLTAAGTYLGTPMYMSPEQVDGLKIDARSDLYSLGATFYHAFVGQPPFMAELATSLLYKHKYELPLPPQQMVPEFPENLGHLLLRLMAKKPQDRPQSAHEAAELIRTIHAGKPVAPPPESAPASSSSVFPTRADRGKGAGRAPSRGPNREAAPAGPDALRQIKLEMDAKTALLEQRLQSIQQALDTKFSALDQRMDQERQAQDAAFKTQERDGLAERHEHAGLLSRKLAGWKVLVVEDDPDTRELVRTVLERHGALVAAVTSVREALDTFNLFKPDVLISDIMMPGEDGYVLIEKIRTLKEEAGRRVPAIALTAYAKAEDRTRLLSAGYQLHLAKPFEPTALANAVAHIAKPNEGR